MTRCVVDGCQRAGVFDMSISDDDVLDVKVCKGHYFDIVADVSAWRITTIISEHGGTRVAVVPYDWEPL